MSGTEPQRQDNSRDLSHDFAEGMDACVESEADSAVTAPAIDRRQSTQRRSRLARENVGSRRAPVPHALKRYILPVYWWYIAPALLASFVLAGLLSASLPSLEIIGLTAIASGTAASARWLVQVERAPNPPNALAKILCWFAIVVPFTAFACSLVVWNYQTGLGWPWIIAGLIALNATAFSLLTERPLQQLTCLTGSWGAMALFVGTAETIGGLALALAAIAIIGIFERKSTLRRRAAFDLRERERNRAEDILRDYEETGQGWFWETDRRGQLTYISTSVARTLRRKRSDLIQRPFADLFDLGSDNQAGERTLTFQLASRSSFQELGVKANVQGEDRWWSVSGRPAYDSFGNFLGFRGSGTDLTEKKRSEESVHRLAQYDSLTGLANRFHMQQSLDKILAAPIELQRECSVFLLDLDRFKQVNDTLGHPAGDALLKQVAQRLERTVGNEGRVGRLGGDEFEVILPGRVPHARLSQLAQEIIAALSQPYSVEGQRVTIGASMGIATAPDNGDTSEQLIRNSDLALYAAKDGGRGRYHFFSDDLHSVAEERASLEEDLRDAIENGNLELHYQPVVHSGDSTIAGFEALLRWHHPTQGWMSPAKFIPVAEDSGLIPAIGEWAIRTVCSDLAKWPENIRCAVNVSPIQFASPQLPAIVTHAIASAQINPSRLELEITESVFLGDTAATEAMFAALKRVGVRLALDDFGTGYSSLGYLKRAPFDKIKIDQGFVRGATQPGNRNGAIITAIASLAKSLNMDTTAEGVETLDELELVRSLGCSHVQGYIFSKAVSFDAASALIERGPSLQATGYRSARHPRQMMLRKVVIEHGGEFYDGRVRNISQGGALVEGLWDVPVGTGFTIALSTSTVVKAKTIWSRDDRMGIAFERPLAIDSRGKVVLDSDADGDLQWTPEADAA